MEQLISRNLSKIVMVHRFVQMIRIRNKYKAQILELNSLHKKISLTKDKMFKKITIRNKYKPNL